MKRPRIWILNLGLLGTTLLSGCDQVSERAGFPDPARVEAEGKAIGGACRHAGRGLEDCYRLNETASKSAIYAGWKEMNEYMTKNNLQSVAPTLPPEQLAPPEPVKKKKSSADEEASAHQDDAKTPSKNNHEPTEDAHKEE